MIAKCITILAIVAQINGSPCGCVQPSIVLPSCGSSSCSSSCSSGSVVIQSSSSSSSDSSSTSGAITKNIVAKGKYPVALKTCGPNPDKQVSVTTSHVTAPVQEKPTVRLSASIPAPKTISHTCTCYKTILRPRIHQQVISVPSVQRYLETIHKPIVENVQYEAVPVNCIGSGSSSSGSSGFQFVEVGGSSFCRSPCKTIEIPRCQVLEAPKCQTVEIPSCQATAAPVCQAVEISSCQVVPAPKCQTIEIPSYSAVPAPACQTVEIPSCAAVAAPVCQTVEAPSCQVIAASKCQTIEIPSCHAVPAPVCQTIEIPRFQVVEAPKCQTIEIPRVQIVEAPSCQVEAPVCFSVKSSCSPCQC